MSTVEAISSVERYLQKPPEERSKSISYVDLNEIQLENISATLNQKSGFWNQLTNRMQWEVTIKYNGIEPKIVMDFLTELKKETFKLSKYLLKFKTINHNIRI